MRKECPFKVLIKSSSELSIQRAMKCIIKITIFVIKTLQWGANQYQSLNNDFIKYYAYATEHSSTITQHIVFLLYTECYIHVYVMHMCVQYKNFHTEITQRKKNYAEVIANKCNLERWERIELKWIVIACTVFENYHLKTKEL